MMSPAMPLTIVTMVSTVMQSRLHLWRCVSVAVAVVVVEVESRVGVCAHDDAGMCGAAGASAAGIVVSLCDINVAGDDAANAADLDMF